MQYIQLGENDLLKRRVYLHLVDATDGITAKTGQTGTCKVSVNGAAPTTSINSIVEIDSTNLPGDYYLTLDPVEIKTAGVVMVRYKSSDTAEFVQIVSILAFDPTQPISLQPGFNNISPDIDYKRIKKMIDEAVGALPTPKDTEKVDLYPVVSALHDLHEAISAVRIPEQVKPDYSPLIARFEALEKTIKALKIPTLDTKPVLEEVKAQAQHILAELEDLQEEITDKIAEVNRKSDKATETIVKTMTPPLPPLEGFALIRKYLGLNEKTGKELLNEYLKK